MYLPSFISTSSNPSKFYDKLNTLFIINIKYRPSTAFQVNSKYSAYADTEEEVLFACYSKFRVIKKV